MKPLLICMAFLLSITMMANEKNVQEKKLDGILIEGGQVVIGYSLESTTMVFDTKPSAELFSNSLLHSFKMDEFLLERLVKSQPIADVWFANYSLGFLNNPFTKLVITEDMSKTKALESELFLNSSFVFSNNEFSRFSFVRYEIARVLLDSLLLISDCRIDVSVKRLEYSYERKLLEVLLREPSGFSVDILSASPEIKLSSLNAFVKSLEKKETQGFEKEGTYVVESVFIDNGKEHQIRRTDETLYVYDVDREVVLVGEDALRIFLLSRSKAAALTLASSDYKTYESIIQTIRSLVSAINPETIFEGVAKASISDVFETVTILSLWKSIATSLSKKISLCLYLNKKDVDLLSENELFTIYEISETIDDYLIYYSVLSYTMKEKLAKINFSGKESVIKVVEKEIAPFSSYVRPAISKSIQEELLIQRESLETVGSDLNKIRFAFVKGTIDIVSNLEVDQDWLMKNLDIATRNKQSLKDIMLGIFYSVASLDFYSRVLVESSLYW